MSNYLLQIEDALSDAALAEAVCDLWKHNVALARRPSLNDFLSVEVAEFDARLDDGTAAPLLQDLVMGKKDHLVMEWMTL